MNNIRQFLGEESGAVITAEYVLFLAAVGLIAAAGIWVLYGGLQYLFGLYATYFQGSS